MAITITKADVKRKLMIASADTSYDSAIDSLISETQPAIEYSIDPSYLADSTTGLQATLKLGILEVICGEFLAQMLREVGASEEFSMAGLSLGPRNERGVELLQQGAERLSPYLQAQEEEAQVQTLSSTLDADRVLVDDGSAW